MILCVCGGGGGGGVRWEAFFELNAFQTTIRELP